MWHNLPMLPSVRFVVLAAALAIGCQNKGGSHDKQVEPNATELPTTAAPGGGLDLVSPGEFTAMGELDKDVVKRVVKDNLMKLQLCYEQTLLEHPGIEGKVVVRFTIGIEGSVSDVAAAGIHPDVERCVTERFRSFRFPKPSARGVVPVLVPARVTEGDRSTAARSRLTRPGLPASLARCPPTTKSSCPAPSPAP